MLLAKSLKALARRGGPGLGVGDDSVLALDDRGIGGFDFLAVVEDFLVALERLIDFLRLGARIGALPRRVADVAQGEGPGPERGRGAFCCAERGSRRLGGDLLRAFGRVLARRLFGIVGALTLRAPVLPCRHRRLFLVMGRLGERRVAILADIVRTGDVVLVFCVHVAAPSRESPVFGERYFVVSGYRPAPFSDAGT